MRAFGIGSFSFVINELGQGKEITVDNFFTELEKMLYKLPTINNVLISYDQQEKERVVSYSEEVLGMNLDGRINPFIDGLDVAFDLSLSKRVQDELCNSKGIYFNSDATTENFRVYIRNYYYTASTFIEVLNANEYVQGSNSVFIVREYLNESFNNLGGFISFDSQGPSPFHADFYILHESGGDEDEYNRGISTKISDGMGYADIKIYVNPSNHIAEDEVMDFVIFKMISEVDYYYALLTKKKQRSNEWALIEMLMDEFISLTSGKARMFSYFKKKKLLNDLLRELWVFKSNEISEERARLSSYNDQYKKDNINFIKAFIDREIAEDNKYPIDDTKSLVQFYEGKNSKAFELMITFLTALIGGIVGAIATALTQGGK